MHFSILIPVYNDTRVIRTIKAVRRVFRDSNHSYEIVVSGTLDKPNLLPESIKFVHASGRKGDNLVAGIRVCRGSYVLLIDADFPIHANNLSHVLARTKRAPVILGYRTYRGNSELNIRYRRNRTALFRKLVSFVFPELTGLDTQFGFKLVQRTCIEKIISSGMYCGGLAFDIELVLKAKRAGYRIECVYLEYVHDNNSVINFFAAFYELHVGLVKLKWSSIYTSLVTKYSWLSMLKAHECMKPVLDIEPDSGIAIFGPNVQCN